jgi:hypothetical protein
MGYMSVSSGPGSVLEYGSRVRRRLLAALEGNEFGAGDHKEITRRLSISNSPSA